MSNWVDLQLDVLAASRYEIDNIEAALQQPSQELLASVAQEWSGDPKDIAADVKELVTFKPTRNLGFTDPSLNKERRFENESKAKFWNVVSSHVHLVSQEFPTAIFFLTYWDTCMSYAGKTVIRGGREVRHFHDGNQQAQGYEWTLPNIFAPYETEYHNGAEFGTLWNSWLLEMEDAVATLGKRYSASNAGEQETS